MAGDIHHIVKRYIVPMGFVNWTANQSQNVTELSGENSFLRYENEELFYAEETARAVDSPALLIYDIFIPMLGIFIIFFNGLVVISSGFVLKKGQQPRSTYLFLGNVGLCDLVTGVAVLFGHFYPNDIRGEINCAFQLGLIVSSTLASIYSVLLIAFDRFLYILKGMQYQIYIYPSRARLLIVFTWILGIIIGFLPAMGWRGDTNNGQICWFILLAPAELVLLTTIIGLIPILIVIVLYSIILHRAIKKVNELKRATGGTEISTSNLRFFRGGSSTVLDEIENECEVPLQQTARRGYFVCCCKGKSKYEINGVTVSIKQPSKWKAVKVVLLTTGSFIITWIPYFIASTMFVYCNHEQTPNLCRNLKVAIASPLAVLGFANSLLNPIIYAWWHNGFRTSATNSWKRLKCFSCCCNKSNDFSTINLSQRVTNSTTSNYTASTTSINLNSTNISALTSANNLASTNNLINNQYSSTANECVRNNDTN